MRKKFEFSEEDKKIIKESIQGLEKESSGEIVIYFARDSDNYFEACWKLAALFGSIGIVLIGIMSWLWLLPLDFDIIKVSLITTISMIVGFSIPYFIHSVRLGFVPIQTISHRVLTKARDIFLQEQIFNTIDRTGILIYISELEHQVQILGDSGINEKIEQNDWNVVLGLVTEGIKANNTAQGIAGAVLKCKALLLSNGFVIREDNTNELSDDIRIED